MERRSGVVGTVAEGVFFTEADIVGVKRLVSVEVELAKQNADLVAVKREMARRVKACGGNALIQFKYGQRAHKWWENLLPKWDSESWHGSGVAAVLPPEVDKQ